MDYSKYQLVEIGDFAMNHMDLLTGYVDISPYKGVTSPDYRVFTLNNKRIAYSRYYVYLLQMCYHLKIFYSYGKGVSLFGRWRLPSDEFNDIEFPVIPLPNSAPLPPSLTAKPPALTP
jgi:type I restriction enzyme S subunit